jgi:DNA-binding NtrC family response regulator
MNCLQRILVVSRQERMQALAQQVSQQIFMADDVAEARDMVARIRPEAVVFDDQATPEHVRQFVAATDNPRCPIPIVVVPGPGQCAEAFGRVGAHACLDSDIDVERLRQAVLKLAREEAASSEGQGLEEYFVDPSAAATSIVGRSRAVQDELRLIRLVGQSQCDPVLIVGETGTGKEMAARAVHQARGAAGPFVAVNCAALTANLLESELFGHAKGAFTGADREKTGLFELAGSGTIFLDEISEMPLDLQAKLLRVLQEKAFRKVGGVQEILCHATVIASSNRHLKTEVQANRFRRDLYYRLSVCPISLSPLRSPKRRDDIVLLAQYFVRTSSICPAKRGKITSLTKLAAEMLEKHDWPGNVRELRNVMDRAILLENTDKIGLSSIVLDPESFEPRQESLVAPGLKDFSLARAERELIARALKETGWQKTQAASLLGITRATLYAKVKQYNIEREGDSLKSVGPCAAEPVRELEPVEV